MQILLHKTFAWGINNIIGHGSLDYYRNYYYPEYENVPVNVY